MSIGGKTYARKRNAEPDSGRKLVLSGNRLGLVLNEQTTILKGIKTSIDNSTKASIRNVKVINQSLKDIKKEERIAKIKARKKERDERKEKNRLAREERIKKSRERLGARESALETKPAGGESQGEDVTFAKKGGFFDNLGKFIKLLLTFAALKWLSNPENAKMVARFLMAMVKVLKVIYRVVEFGVVKILEGFTNLFGSDSSFFDRFKGFLQFLIGAVSLFFTIRWLKNPLKILGDAKKLFKLFKVIPKAIGLIGKLAKGIVLATKAGVSKMKGIGGVVLGGAALLGGGALVANMMGGDDAPQEPTTPPPPKPAPKEPAPAEGNKKEPAKAESGAIIPIIPDLTGFDSVPAPRYSMESGGTVPAAAPRYSMAGGGIVPFRGMSRRVSAQRGRIISGRNQGYSAQVGGQTIEAHGTEAVIPIKNRYTDSGNDPIAALVGNSKKMAEGMGSLIPLPMKLIGGSILVGLGSLLGMAPFGIGAMLAPFAKTLLAPILQVFGIPENLLDKAMKQAGGAEKGKDFATAISDTIKEWFSKILPGGSVATTPGSSPPGPSPNVLPPSDLKVGDAVDIGTKVKSGAAIDPSASRNILEFDPNKKDYKTGEVVKMDDGSLRQYDGQGWSEFKPEGQGAVSGGNWKPVLDLIAEGESNTSGGYDAMNPGRNTRAEGNPITEMTMRQVRDMAMKSPGGTGAAGRYQIMPEFRGSNVFKKLVEDVGLDYDKDKFTPANQDKMAIHRLEVTRFGNDWLAGKIDDVSFANSLANEWAALKKSHGGGAHDNKPGNRATIDQSKLLKALKEVKGAQRMNHGGTVTPQRMFLGGIGKAISGAVSGVGKAIGGALSSPIGKIIGTAASFIPGVGPIMAGVNAVAGMMSGNPLGALMSGLNMIPGFGGMLGGIGDTIGGFLNSPLGQMGTSLVSGIMSGDIMGAMGGMGNILAQGGEMIFGPGFTQMFGGTLDMLNVAGKGLGASDLLKKMGGGLLDFGVGQLAGALGGPDAKKAMVPGGSTVLNVNAVRMIGALMKTQVVQQNAAKIKGLEGVTQMMGDKMVKLTGDVISGVLLDKGSVAELPPQVMDQAMAQILPMIHNAITSASAAAQQQVLGASQPGGGKMDPGSLARSAAGSALSSGVSGTLSAIAGKITGTGIR